MLTALVECYSGYQYPERPVAFQWQGDRLKVEQILAEWRIPDGKRFQVRTQDGQLFDLFFREMYDEWQIYPV
ncbi:MAG: hypothetical protein IH586_24210 [Anaerolineaceae bacterium]|nr:hypothetical protein [Anaerolineaceae bacterium]